MSFASLYQKLNSAQKLAVDTIDGPVMVLAGPGTGKTHILTLRIANILASSDIDPRNILALTFTDSAAKTMRERLISLIGSAAYNVRIETFHALADSIIREYPEFFPFKRDASPLTQIEQFEIFRLLLSDPTITHLRTPGSKYHYIKDLISAISTLKRENIGPEKLTKIVTDEQDWFESEKDSLKNKERLDFESLIGKHLELAKIYTQYELKLHADARYDFDDMLLETLAALKSNPLLLASMQEEFQYILVDEYQDTNGVQNAIVDLIASFWEEPNLFVVGDPNQTIYRFQGALLENSIGFAKRYPNASVISLSQGYRSNQQIYNQAHKLISNTLSNFHEPLTAQHNRGEIILKTTQTEDEEKLLLIQDIYELLASNVDPAQIAVLYKKNSDGDMLSDLFNRAKIPFHIERELNALTNPKLQQFLNLIKLIHAINNSSEYRLLFDVLMYNWFTPASHLSPTEKLKLIRAFADQKQATNTFGFLSAQHSEIAETLNAWCLDTKNMTFPKFIENLATVSGFLNYITLQPHGPELKSYITFFQEINQLSANNHNFGLNEFIQYLATMEEQDLTLPINTSLTNEGVTLSTVHKAKGREWQHVFLPFLREGYWGKTRQKSGLKLPNGIVSQTITEAPDAEERRLLFVAYTRAKESLHLSHALSKNSNGRSSPALPSPYLLELEENILEPNILLDPKYELLTITPVDKSEIEINDELKNWVSSLVENFTLSHSSLNAYLSDPIKFFERYLLKMPEATTAPLAFGNAIHTTLEWYYSKYKNSQTLPTIDMTVQFFEHNLASYTLTNEDRHVRLLQGKKVLKEYLEIKSKSSPNIMAIEESFGWKRGKIVMNGIELTGKIDRIDVSDSEHKVLKVIDYKTGKIKGPGEILGTAKSTEFSQRELQLPESIRSKYKRQLLFYKLLLSLDPKYKNFTVSEGCFEFVEPEKNKFVSRNVVLTETDVELLKELIKTVSQEIRELKFLGL